MSGGSHLETTAAGEKGKLQASVWCGLHSRDRSKCGSLVDGSCKCISLNCGVSSTNLEEQNVNWMLDVNKM